MHRSITKPKWRDFHDDTFIWEACAYQGSKGKPNCYTSFTFKECRFHENVFMLRWSILAGRDLTLFLPPANKVWGKVMALLMNVCLSTRHFCLCRKGVCLQREREVCIWEVCIGGGQTPHPHTWDTTGQGQQAGGMHPTGMHTSIVINLKIQKGKQTEKQSSCNNSFIFIKPWTIVSTFSLR